MPVFPIYYPPGGGRGSDEIGIGVPPAPAPPVAGTAGPCECGDLSVVWQDGSTSYAMVLPDNLPAVFAIVGALCPDATFTPSLEWDPDVISTDPPIVEEFGVAAWRVLPTGAGMLTVSLSGTCGAQDVATDPIMLTISADNYGACLIDLTDEYQNIQVFMDAGCVAPAWPNDGDNFYDWDGDVFIVWSGGNFPEVPFYQGDTVAPGIYMVFDELAELANGRSIDVRITVTDNSIDNANAHGIFIDDHTGADPSDFPSSWERTVADAADFFTGAGSGDGAGTSGQCSFRIEVKLSA